MTIDELKHKKQELESRLFQIIQEQKDLNSEYSLLEKELNKTLGKLEVLSENTAVVVQKQNVSIPAPVTHVVPEIQVESTFDFSEATLLDQKPNFDSPSVEGKCHIQGAHFFEG